MTHVAAAPRSACGMCGLRPCACGLLDWLNFADSDALDAACARADAFFAEFDESLHPRDAQGRFTESDTDESDHPRDETGRFAPAQLITLGRSAPTTLDEAPVALVRDTQTGKEYIEVFHGTSKDRVRAILSAGILPGDVLATSFPQTFRGISHEGQVYVTTTLPRAKVWAKYAASEHTYFPQVQDNVNRFRRASRAVVLRLRIPVADLPRLSYDPHFERAYGALEHEGLLRPEWVDGVSVLAADANETERWTPFLPVRRTPLAAAGAGAVLTLYVGVYAPAADVATWTDSDIDALDAAADFDESEHPRDAQGRFTETGGAQERTADRVTAHGVPYSPALRPRRGESPYALGTRLQESIDPDARVWVYHATDAATARRFAAEGVKVADKPRNFNRDAYERGEYEKVFYQPGVGLAAGLTVGLAPQDIDGYGRELVAVRVRFGDIQPSPEARQLGNHTGAAALAVNDAHVPVDIPPSDVRVLPHTDDMRKWRIPYFVEDLRAAIAVNWQRERDAHGHFLPGTSAGPAEAKTKTPRAPRAPRAPAAPKTALAGWKKATVVDAASQGSQRKAKHWATQNQLPVALATYATEALWQGIEHAEGHALEVHFRPNTYNGSWADVSVTLVKQDSAESYYRGRQVVATLSFTLVANDPDNAGHARVTSVNFHVEPSFQRHGIATRVVATLAQHARAAGVTRVDFHAVSDGHGGMNGAYTWAKAGFPPADADDWHRVLLGFRKYCDLQGVTLPSAVDARVPRSRSPYGDPAPPRVTEPLSPRELAELEIPGSHRDKRVGRAYLLGRVSWSASLPVL